MMSSRSAPRPEGRRRPTNVSIDENVLKAARACGLNISRIAEEALSRAVKEKERDAWRVENAEAIAYQNRLVEEEGAFGDDLRTF